MDKFLFILDHIAILGGLFAVIFGFIFNYQLAILGFVILIFFIGKYQFQQLRDEQRQQRDLLERIEQRLK